MANPQIVLVTGGNTGLGYEILKALLQSPTPYTLILSARNPTAATEALTELTQAVIKTQHGKLDVLINNAGASFDRQVESNNLTSEREAFNKTWDTNVTGTHVLTTSLMPLLLLSLNPRLLFMTSGTSALSETEKSEPEAFARINASPAAGWPKDEGVNPVIMYRSVKTGLNMLMTQWWRRLRADGVKVWAVSPGFLATGLAGIGAERLKQMGALDPAEGGKFVRDVVEGKRDGDVGKVIRASMVQPW